MKKAKTKSILKSRNVTFIELLVTSLLIEFIIIFFLFFSDKIQEVVRDSIRKREISQIGKMITNPCFESKELKGDREYDLSFIIKEMIKERNGYSENLAQDIGDPRMKSNGVSMYFYKIDDTKKNCVLYANLESSLNEENLHFKEPVPGGGNGILKSDEKGWNNSYFYFQYSN